jgi:hypothetical protein
MQSHLFRIQPVLSLVEQATERVFVIRYSVGAVGGIQFVAHVVNVLLQSVFAILFPRGQRLLPRHF